MSVKHKARTRPAVANATRRSAGQAQARNSQLRARFPARAVPACWPETTRSLEDTARRLACPPFLAASHATSAGRRHGVINLLRWLSTFPGESWQQRWLTSGVEEHPGAGWVQLPLAWLAEHGQPTGGEADRLSSGLLMLICGDVIRPGLAWMLTRTHRYLASTMAHTRDPDGFARLRQLAAAGPASGRMDGQIAATRIATLLACKGGRIDEITVGDCVELVDTQRRVQARGGQKKVDFYLRLRALGIFPPDAPATIRAFGLAGGQLSIEELVDRYRLRCTPVRDLIVDYLRERQPALDYASLDATCRTLAGLFWSKIETLAPHIDTIRLPPQIARQWKEDLATKTRTITTPDGRRVELTSPRLNATDELLRVRAFYLDIAQWAVEEPTRWGPWAVPCPIGDAEIGRTKMRQHRKSRMDQRTRERLPVLPVLVRTAERAATRGRTPPARRRRHPTRRAHPRHRRDTAPRGHGHQQDQRPQHLGAGHRPRQAAQPDLRRRRGILGLRRDRNPAPDRHPRRGAARADPPQHHRVPAALHRRARAAAADRPLQDRHRTAAAGQPRTRRRAQRDRQPAPRTERRDPAGGRLRRAGAGLEPAHAAAVPTQRRQRAPGDHPYRAAQTAAQRPRRHRPDRRRRRTTGLLPARLPKDLRHRRDHERPAAAHRADHLRAREHSAPRIGYKAIYPAEAIEAHRAFIARRRATRPGEEYRTPTDEEWDDFLGPLREAESLHRHLRTRLRNTLHP